MGKRVFFKRKGTTSDSIFLYTGFSISVGYLCIILGIVVTLMVGAWQSIERYSFAFLWSKNWSVAPTVMTTPRVDITKGEIMLRFSATVLEQDINQVIQLRDSNSEQQIAFESVRIVNKNLFLYAPLSDGIYSLSVASQIKNSSQYPLLYSYLYTFTVSDGVIHDGVLEKFDEKHTLKKGELIYGALPFLFGTLATSLLAMLFSVPFALAIAIYLNEYEKNTRQSYILSSIADLLAGIPSVIYGFWGMFFLVPYFGSNIFTASLVLAIMSLPYSTAMMRESIALVPKSLRYAGYAMGATKYAVLLHVIIPYAKSGIIAGIILSLGRALGETLAVTMVIGNSTRMTFSIFEPAQTIASLIANEYAEASGMKQSALIELGFLLICVSVFFSLLGRFLIRGRK